MRDAGVVEIVRRHAIRVDLEAAASRLLEKWGRHEVDLLQTYPTGA
jgi:hypothetical protein